MSESDDCQHCQYWARGYVHDYPDSPINGNHGHHGDGSAGDCRRHAPTRGAEQSYTPGAARIWPQTARRDWCGDFDASLTGPKT